MNYFRYYSADIVTLDDLVEFILEQDDRDADETDVAIHLHHATRPKLADAGFIDYDRRHNTVRYCEPERSKYGQTTLLRKAKSPYDDVDVSDCE